MCVNNQNTSQQEVEEILQFLTTKQATPLKQLLAAISLQAFTDGGICVAMANAPEQDPMSAPPQPLEGGTAPPPGIHGGPVWQPPEKDVGDDGPATGNYM